MHGGPLKQWRSPQICCWRPSHYRWRVSSCAQLSGSMGLSNLVHGGPLKQRRSPQICYWRPSQHRSMEGLLLSTAFWIHGSFQPCPRRPPLEARRVSNIGGPLARCQAHSCMCLPCAQTGRAGAPISAGAATSVGGSARHRARAANAIKRWKRSNHRTRRGHNLSSDSYLLYMYIYIYVCVALRRWTARRRRPHCAGAGRAIGATT